MSDTFWKPSDEQLRTILLLEVVGLLHDLGKLSNGFIKRVAEDRPANFRYDYELLADPNMVFPQMEKSISKHTNTMQKRANDANRDAPFKDRPDMTRYFQSHSLQGWDEQQYNLAELLLITEPKYVGINWSQILGKSMEPAKLIGRLHGVAHYEKEEAEKDQYKQPFADTWATSPFGVENHIPVDTPGVDLTVALTTLPLHDISKILTDKRRDWLAVIRKLMAKGIAETQRPTNEVSLWDWGYTVATMTKGAAAWIFKNGWPAALDDIPYRTLRINLNRLERYIRSEKISDALGVRQTLEEAFKRVRTLLEETYALANRFYHDETGDYYLFPDLYSEDEMTALRDAIQEQFPSDLCPQVHLGERVTAGELDSKSTSYAPQAVRRLVAEPREQALREDAVRSDNNLYLFEEEWSEGRPENAEICTVCGVRPVGYPRQGTAPGVERELARWATQEKAKQRNVCRVCLDRRGRRAQEWVTGDQRGTIWTDEVADDNGRLALFIGKLGLEGWLDGTLLSTIKVTGSTTKKPSPARLYRIAETARSFWRQVTDEIAPKTVGRRLFRLALYPHATSLLDLGDYHTYELNVDGFVLSVVWDKPNGRFLSVENLAYFASRRGVGQNELAGLLQGQTFNILEPSAFQQPGQVLNTVQIERVEKLGGYQPAIPLLAEPGVCMILVPADKVLDLARTVKREYERQMGRVRDRLPLYMGLVFCPRRTPIRAVLEAGRSMLNMAGGEQWKDWRLKDKSPNPGECELVFENGITWRVPILAGDCKTRDKWYPRLYQGFVQRDAKPTLVTELQINPPKGGPNPLWRVWVRPSRFDFEFLDTTGRRFEICYGKDGRRPRRTRPFYLEDMDRLDVLWKLMRCLATSQRHQVIRAIETTRETWYGRNDGNQAQSDDVLWQFVADTLAGATWPKEQPWTSIHSEWQEKLIVAGVSGELADLAELHMEILKE
ncbi:hypothetical protein HX99_07200 [Peptococcaceae bacterium SCADC1_2_3]|nr:hypothetical protein DK28_0212555 [Peptococcaceae bacterium SCADC1_2_3]KFI36868.1 hypothetical protein HX99_07200 [Peptococcaceae bacterium SCADC1_2_3]KFI37476.1 hypothetical protein HY02_06415 [Peptococcaceae bacterium SCADC1_2_3]